MLGGEPVDALYEILRANVRLPRELLGDGAPEVHAECVQRSRIAWCALAVGCAQAVLDYVIPYVNERTGHDTRVGVAYALVYPVAMITKIVVAQVLAGL